MENLLEFDNPEHKAGFVNIVGLPNVGKSTLMNRMVGEKLSIISSKAQTTRQRIMGILNGEDFQIVYSDTPGVMEPKYQLHKSMMGFVQTSLEDADVVLFVTDLFEKNQEMEEFLAEQVIASLAPVIVLMNKNDLAHPDQIAEKKAYWKKFFPKQLIQDISARDGHHVGELFDHILDLLPLHPPFFPKDEISDKSERFFASEIIREKIFLHYKQEIPYASEVVVTEFRESEDIIRIRSEIYVERDSQKAIIIGKKGEAIKQVGIEARADLEAFFGKQVFLEQYVRVEKDWRKHSGKLRKFGF